MRAQPSYIRTIKPNQNRSSTEYDTKAVLHQVKYLGLQENIRVRRAGFAYRNTFEKMVERFYLLSPATSYAGEYTWQGDSKSGCEKILTDTGIAKDEWQMGVTKAFIKNPETVSLSCVKPVCYRLNRFDVVRSSSLWRRCETDTGITWLLESSVLGGTICGISMNVLDVYNASGRITKKGSNLPKSETMGIRFSLGGKRDGASVCLVIEGSWVITSTSMGRARWEKSWQRLVGLVSCSSKFLSF